MKRKHTNKKCPQCEFSDCVELDGVHKIISLKDAGKKVRIVQRDAQSIKKVRIDNCVLKNTECCDYAIIRARKVAVLVELKGVDIKKGAQQLISTYKTLSVMML